VSPVKSNLVLEELVSEELVPYTAVQQVLRKCQYFQALQKSRVKSYGKRRRTSSTLLPHSETELGILLVLVLDNDLMILASGTPYLCLQAD